MDLFLQSLLPTLLPPSSIEAATKVAEKLKEVVSLLEDAQKEAEELVKKIAEFPRQDFIARFPALQEMLDNLAEPLAEIRETLSIPFSE